MSDSHVAVVPGTLLDNLANASPGDGVYELDGNIVASLAGNVVFHTVGGKKVVSVISSKSKCSAINVGNIVVGRVVKTNYNQAFVDILALGDNELSVSSKGVIRREDIRATEIDKVVVHEFFKAGDFVRAAVISLGDMKHFYLSTSDNGLGVIKIK